MLSSHLPTWKNFIGAIYPPRFIVKVKEGTLLCPFPTVINNKKKPGNSLNKAKVEMAAEQDTFNGR